MSKDSNSSDNLKERLDTINELNALQLIVINSNSFKEFYNENFEYFKIRKMSLQRWIGFKYLKTDSETFDLCVRNLLQMYYIDLKYSKTFKLVGNV